MIAVASGTEPLQQLAVDAIAEKTPLRIAGRSTWIDAGRPVNATRIASTATHAGIVDYVPGDLTITVRSGTTLHEIDEATKREGQWLPLDPFGSVDGTIGATIATGSFGPLAAGFGRTRDLVLGIEFVTGEGKVVRGGGRVVKNVAGYDLVRLITGSWGTLGIITEVTLRLYALPEASMTLSLGIPDGLGALKNRIASVVNGRGTAFAAELISSSIAERIGLSAEPQMLVRIGGNRAAVAAQHADLVALGGPRIVKEETWDLLRGIDNSNSSTVVRISGAPSRAAEMWINARNSLRDVQGAMMHCTPSLGIVRCLIPASVPPSTIESLVASTPTASVAFERLPSDMWATFSSTVVADRISQGIKRAFDPSNILNPGILGPIA